MTCIGMPSHRRDRWQPTRIQYATDKYSRHLCCRCRRGTAGSTVVALCCPMRCCSILSTCHVLPYTGCLSPRSPGSTCGSASLRALLIFQSPSTFTDEITVESNNQKLPQTEYFHFNNVANITSASRRLLMNRTSHFAIQL